MSTVLSTPWTPTLDRDKCAPCALYDSVVDEEATPNAIDDAAWTMEAMELELEAAPDGKDALWEGILALWRLKLCEERATNDKSWKNLVLAWLHRHGELCRYLLIPPFQVVVLYAKTLLRKQSLPVQMLPSWDALEAEPELDSDPTPKLNRKQTWTQQSMIAVPQTPSENVDLEMIEKTGPSVSASTRKGKERARSGISASASESQPPESDVGSVRSKRQRSPVREQRSSKRVRKRNEPEMPAETVDLSEYTFQDRTKVSLSLIPALRDMVCKSCKSSKTTGECVPIWYKNGKSASLRCQSCMDGRNRCSFKDVNWGIHRWPTLTAKAAAKRRQAKETAAKPKQAPLDVNEVAPGPSNLNQKVDATRPSNIIQEDPAIQLKTHFEDVFISTASPITKSAIESDPAPTPAASPSPVLVATPVQDRPFNPVPIHDVRQYEQALSNPNSSRHYLKMKAAEVRVVATREVSDAHTLVEFVESRAAVLMDLAQELSDAGSDAE